MKNYSEGKEVFNAISKHDIDKATKAVNFAIETEINALKEAKVKNETLLPEVIEVAAKVAGRIIVTGIGKSGHIAKKIAATLASTGTPSFFVHSTEALHGDCGMFVAGDMAILISNSGTTAEVVQLAKMLKNRDVKTVAFTKNAETPLGKICDLFVDISVDREADPLNLAPTASTTVTLMLGDAIATGLMSLYDFKPKDFKFFHPGGALGAKITTDENAQHAPMDKNK